MKHALNSNLSPCSFLQTSGDDPAALTSLFSLGPDNRIRKRREFNAVFNDSRKIVSSHLVVLVKKKVTDRPRLGLVVSKKVGNAVRRNYVKRCIRELFRVTGFDTNMDVVVIARARCATSDFEQIQKTWKFCMHQVRKQKNRPSKGF